MPPQGSVRIGGRDLREMQVDSVRRALGEVPQDLVLFNDTIYYNINYGRLDATREEVEGAAKQVGSGGFTVWALALIAARARTASKLPL